MKKKVLSALLCASMVATMVAGCGGSSSETTDSNAAADNSAADNSAAAGTEEAAAPAASGDTIALRVWAAEEDQTLTNELIEQFKEANPDQTFDITVGVESEANAKDDILVDPTAAADVFAFASDQLIDLVDAGVLQAVQDVDTVSSQNVAGAVEAATVDGTLYAYPMSADNGYFLYYDSNVVTDPTNWDAILTDCAAAVQEAFGDGYAACALPTYTCAGNQVPMGSAAGYKMIGVNANSAQVGWAMELAKFLTNEQSQETRFAERQIGPSNIAAGESDEVKANVAIAAVTAQNGANGVVQIVGSGYWDPSKAFGEIIAQGNPDGTDVQTLLDNLVESASQPTE